MTGQQLKNSILQLAIQGKLVPQDSNDEPASALLERIRKEKEQLVKEGKLKKKDLVTTPISDEEKPFEIPENWEWCRLKDVFTMQAGKTISASELSKERDEKHQYKCFGGNGIRGYIDRYNNEGLYPIVGRQGALCGCVNMANGKFHATEHAVVVTTYASTCEYWAYYILIALNLNQYATATAQPGLSVANILETYIPLPPLSEQHRIVAKIEELMPLVEEYDKAQSELESLNKALPEALKKSILQEAIQGKLGTNNPDDEPASELLKRIRAEKAKLIKDKKIKKEKPLAPITDEEKPFVIPENWEWCRLNDMGIFERGNGIKRDETKTEGYPCVRYGEMYTHYRKNPTFDRTISFTTKDVFDKCRKAQKGDLFMALTGENKQDIALAAQYIGDEDIAVGGDLCHFTVLESYALYFVYLINSPYYSSKKELLATGDIIVHISADKLGSIPIPLPPLAEQHRIVEKLNSILPKLNDLK